MPLHNIHGLERTKLLQGSSVAGTFESLCPFPSHQRIILGIHNRDSFLIHTVGSYVQHTVTCNWPRYYDTQLQTVCTAEGLRHKNLCAASSKLVADWLVGWLDMWCRPLDSHWLRSKCKQPSVAGSSAAGFFYVYISNRRLSDLFSKDSTPSPFQTKCINTCSYVCQVFCLILCIRAKVLISFYSSAYGLSEHGKTPSYRWEQAVSLRTVVHTKNIFTLSRSRGAMVCVVARE